MHILMKLRFVSVFRGLVMSIILLQIPHQCTAISLFIPFLDTYNYVYVCNVHTSTVISFIRSSKFVYIVLCNHLVSLFLFFCLLSL